MYETYIIILVEIVQALVILGRLAAKHHFVWLVAQIILCIPILFRQSVVDIDSQEPHYNCRQDWICSAAAFAWVLQLWTVIAYEVFRFGDAGATKRILGISVLCALLHGGTAMVLATYGWSPSIPAVCLLIPCIVYGIIACRFIYKTLIEQSRFDKWSGPWNHVRKIFYRLSVVAMIWTIALGIEAYSDMKNNELAHRIATVVLLTSQCMATLHRGRSRSTYSELGSHEVNSPSDERTPRDVVFSMSSLPSSSSSPSRRSPTTRTPRNTVPKILDKKNSDSDDDKAKQKQAIVDQVQDAMTQSKYKSRMYPNWLNDELFLTLEELGCYQSTLTAAEVALYISEVIQPRLAETTMTSPRLTIPKWCSAVRAVIIRFAEHDPLLRGEQDTDTRYPVVRAFDGLLSNDFQEMERHVRLYVRQRFGEAHLTQTVVFGTVLELARSEADFYIRAPSSAGLDLVWPETFEFLSRHVLVDVVRLGLGAAVTKHQAKITKLTDLMERMQYGLLRTFKESWPTLATCDSDPSSTTTTTTTTTNGTSTSSVIAPTLDDSKTSDQDVAHMVFSASNLPEAVERARRPSSLIGAQPHQAMARILWDGLKTKTLFHHLLFKTSVLCIPVHLLVGWNLKSSIDHHIVSAWRRISTGQVTVRTDDDSRLASRRRSLLSVGALADRRRLQKTFGDMSSMIPVLNPLPESPPLTARALPSAVEPSSDSDLSAPFSLPKPADGNKKTNKRKSSNITTTGRLVQGQVARITKSGDNTLCTLLAVCAMAMRHSSQPPRANAYLNARLAEMPMVHNELIRMIEHLHGFCQMYSHAPYMEYMMNVCPWNNVDPSTTTTTALKDDSDSKELSTDASPTQKIQDENKDMDRHIAELLKTPWERWCAGHTNHAETIDFIIPRIEQDEEDKDKDEKDKSDDEKKTTTTTKSQLSITTSEYQHLLHMYKRLQHITCYFMGLFPISALTSNIEGHVLFANWIGTVDAKEMREAVKFMFLLLFGYFVEAETGKSLRSIVKSALTPAFRDRIHWWCKALTDARVDRPAHTRGTILTSPSKTGKTRFFTFTNVGISSKQRQVKEQDERQTLDALVAASTHNLTVPVHWIDVWAMPRPSTTRLRSSSQEEAFVPSSSAESRRSVLLRMGEDVIQGKRDKGSALALTGSDSEL